MMLVDHLMDAFVNRVNASGREPALSNDVPPSLRLSPADQYGKYDWRIQRDEGIDWVAGIEAALPAKLPPSFRSLVTRYVYPEFEAGGLWFFANTHEQTWHEWRNTLLEHEALSGALLKAGYIQFARPLEATKYDPICFDTGRRAESGEYPIVWIDHEGILCNDKIRVYKEVTPSFVEFVRDYLSGEKP